MLLWKSISCSRFFKYSGLRWHKANFFSIRFHWKRSMFFPPSFNYWYSLVYQQKRVSLGNLGCYFSFCSDSGELYSKKLANFVEKRLKNERAASVSFSNFIKFWVMKLGPLIFILNLTIEMICFRNFCLTNKKTNLLDQDICFHDSLQWINIGCELAISVNAALVDHQFI